MGRIDGDRKVGRPAPHAGYDHTGKLLMMQRVNPETLPSAPMPVARVSAPDAPGPQDAPSGGRQEPAARGGKGSSVAAAAAAAAGSQSRTMADQVLHASGARAQQAACAPLRTAGGAKTRESAALGSAAQALRCSAWTSQWTGAWSWMVPV